MKKLRVTMPNLSVWEIPADVVAEDRAAYYAEKDQGSEGTYDECFARELEYVLSDDFELKDWASNNMNWKDVRARAVCISGVEGTPDDMEEGWVNGECVVVSSA